MFDNIKDIWFTSKLKGQCIILKVCCSQIHRSTVSARKLTGIVKNNCLNILPALIEDYEVTSDALTFWCQLLQLNPPEVSTYEF